MHTLPAQYGSDPMKTDSPTAAKAREQQIMQRLEAFAAKWLDSHEIYVDFDMAAAFAESELAAIQRKVVCSFCGTIPEYDYTKENAQADAILAHIETCEKSPVRQLIDALQEIDKLKAELAATEKRVREECAKAVCDFCRETDVYGPATFGDEWLHEVLCDPEDYRFCLASPIRSLELKGE